MSSNQDQPTIHPANVGSPDSMRGLTQSEVDERRAAGQSNHVDMGTSRPVSAILRANLFTIFNAILGTAALAVLLLGDWRDAVFAIVLVMNLSIGVFTELRSKRTLDALAVLQTPTSQVRRDGHVQTVDNEGLVVDDVLELKLGDQVPADGEVLASSGLEVDEAALTGESHPVHKEVGDKLLSGTSVVGGSGVMLVQVIGEDSWAQKITKEAKKFSKARSEIQESIDKVLRIITLILPVVIIILLWSQLRVDEGDWQVAVVLTVAGIVGMIPQGLVLLTSLNFGITAATLARQKVLVQELPAVEILARVDTLCLDKTGTLTTGEIRGRKLVMRPADLKPEINEGIAKAVLKELVGDETNATAIAVSQLLTGDLPRISDDAEILPFNSIRKWSALSFAAGTEPNEGCCTWVFGAPEIVLDLDSETEEWARKTVRASSEKGRRTVTLAVSSQPLNEENLPPHLVPVLVAVLEEDIRPDATKTLEYFADQGVTVKIISGDSPATVGALAGEIGLRHDKHADEAPTVVDARKLPEIGTEAFRDAAEEADVFGRVTPEQKQGLVHALQDGGRTVAMTGDGVNDALALKTADLGIAMGNGAPATKAVSRLVLVEGKFSVLPHIVAEGRRIIANMERVSSLFLTKTTYAMLIAVTVAILAWPYPFLPRHLTYLSAFTIGVPAFFLSLGPNTRRYKPGFLRRTLIIAIPSGIILTVFALVAYHLTGPGTVLGHTSATVTLIMGAMALLVLLSRPWNTWRITLVVSMISGAILGLLIPFVRNFFALTWPTTGQWLILVALGGAAAALIVIVYFATAKWRDRPVKPMRPAREGAGEGK